MKKQNDSRLWLHVLPRTRTGVLGLLIACSGAHPTPPLVTTAEEHHHHGHGQGHHHRFDDAAAWSKVFDDPARDAWQKPGRIVELLALTPGMTVADVGAGTGYFTPWLSRAVGTDGTVIAEDVEPEMVRWLDARAKREGLPNVRARLGAPSDAKLEPQSVDRVLIVDTWHHIDDRPAFAAKLRAALKPRGAILVLDFTRESPHGPPPAARLAPEKVIAELTEAGLTAEIVRDAGLPYQYVIRARGPD
jgi:cyclopropane fatty-acyl-phospholipid synthase-like methyltransferase